MLIAYRQYILRPIILEVVPEWLVFFFSQEALYRETTGAGDVLCRSSINVLYVTKWIYIANHFIFLLMEYNHAKKKT